MSNSNREQDGAGRDGNSTADLHCPEPLAQPPRESLCEQDRRIPERHHCTGATAREAEEEYPERKTAQHTGGDHRCRTPRENGDDVFALIPERCHIQRQSNSDRRREQSGWLGSPPPSLLSEPILAC